MTYYLTFSCFSLILSVNFPPPCSSSRVSSNTHMGSLGSNWSGWERMLRPAILEMAEPLWAGTSERASERASEGTTRTEEHDVRWMEFSGCQDERTVGNGCGDVPIPAPDDGYAFFTHGVQVPESG